MPNRILKESICVSETINNLDPFVEVFFYRLITQCDDYGRCDARPAILKSKLFPLRNVRLDQIEEALQKLALEELATLYCVDGRPFVQLRGWSKHQRIRNSLKKYPDPPEGQESIPLRVAANRGGPPPESVSESESRIRNPESVSVSRPGEAAEAFRGGFCSAADVKAYQENLDAVEDKAKSIGMAWAGADIAKAESLMAAYSAQWLLTAMDRAANGPTAARSWRYIEGILRSFKEKGGIDDAHERYHRGGQEQGREAAPGIDWAAMQLDIRRY